MSELRVTEAHLRELVAKQGEAAAAIESATGAVDGLGAAVAATHGSVASATAAAVQAAEAARGRAGAQTAAESGDLRDRLGATAVAYADVDQSASQALVTRI